MYPNCTFPFLHFSQAPANSPHPQIPPPSPLEWSKPPRDINRTMHNKIQKDQAQTLISNLGKAAQ